MNELITANVKRVNVIDNESMSTVYVTIDKPVKRITFDKSTSTYAESECTEFSINRSVLTAQLCELNDYVAIYRASLGHNFTQADLGKILCNAKISFTNEFVKEGAVYPGTDVIAEHDKYSVTIKKLELNKIVAKMLENVCAF